MPVSIDMDGRSHAPDWKSWVNGPGATVSARPSPFTLRLDYLPKFQGMRLSMSLCMC